ncbi:MAG: hypothetical protein K9K64_14670 [Desulfohalobiaceae bacterium]|nr:hypothetical protein [Desulfohalobiaceae bacterium]MCF8106723.1 hypothetical protein [Desulfohalobiaceae bacterium]
MTGSGKNKKEGSDFLQRLMAYLRTLGRSKDAREKKAPEESGWKESEEEYQARQKAWLDEVKRKRK